MRLRTILLAAAAAAAPLGMDRETALLAARGPVLHKHADSIIRPSANKLDVVKLLNRHHHMGKHRSTHRKHRSKDHMGEREPAAHSSPSHCSPTPSDCSRRPNVTSPGRWRDDIAAELGAALTQPRAHGSPQACTRVFFFHISYTGGTSLCHAAVLNGAIVSGPDTPFANCNVDALESAAD